MDYKTTLNLPQTKFPMKANLVNKEPEIINKWKAEGLYNIIREQSKEKKKYILHDGPPYANGNIHMGHALNKILKATMFLNTDVFHYLREESVNSNLIIIDPPAFTKNRESIKDACRGYKELNMQVIKRVINAVTRFMRFMSWAPPFLRVLFDCKIISLTGPLQQGPINGASRVWSQLRLTF